MTASKLGRPPIDNPKNKKVTIRLNQSEFELIEECAETLKISKTDVLKKGVQLVKKDIEKATYSTIVAD